MTDNLISTFFRNEILNMSAYKVAEANNLIKLDAMENPYSWPEEIKLEWLEKLKNCEINRYPDPQAKELVALIKQTNQVPAHHDVILGNGSDEIIQLLLLALPDSATVLAPSPSFIMYKQVAHSLGLNYLSSPLLADNFELDLSSMIKAIELHQPTIIFLAYPNNPTGNLFKTSDIESILNKAPGFVVIDEAYAPFAESSFMSKIESYSNLLVMRTVSKLGLAGLRLGYMVGKKEILQQLNKIRLPYNINSLTQMTTIFALKNQIIFDSQTKQICSDRKQMLHQLNNISGIKAFPSSANFILFKTPKNQANSIYQSLIKQGILIKNLSPEGRVLTDCLRVTIGKPEENSAFISALIKSLKT